MRAVQVGAALALTLLQGGAARGDGAAPDAAAAAALASAFASAEAPTAGPARSIGGYSAGCLQGAVALPARGPGFLVARPERKRNYGHPLLIALVRELGAQARRRALGDVLIGDLSQPRGGPAPNGHASHQTGLDADIWFASPAQARGKGGARHAVPMVDIAKRRLTKAYGARVPTLVRWAASDPRVSRVFVHPLIKQRLCRTTRGDRAWLGKVRPWWGHHQHFHVRLACPPDSADCAPQPSIGGGDGCARIEWWLAPGAEDERAQGQARYQERVASAPALPAACAGLAR